MGHKIYYILNSSPEHTSIAFVPLSCSVEIALRAAEKYLIRDKGIRIGKITKVVPY